MHSSFTFIVCSVLIHMDNSIEIKKLIMNAPPTLQYELPSAIDILQAPVTLTSNSKYLVLMSNTWNYILYINSKIVIAHIFW